MRWVVTYQGAPAFDRADGLFNIGQIRKIGYVRDDRSGGNSLSVVILPEGYVIYETMLAIEKQPSDPVRLGRWNENYANLIRKILLDVIAELEKKGAEGEIVDLMRRFSFEAPKEKPAG